MSATSATILVSQQCTKDGAQLQELMPVLVGPRQAIHLQTEDDADVIETHFRQQPLESEPSLGGGTAHALVLIDNLDPCGRPLV